MLDKCTRCGSTGDLVKHHISYLPEIIEIVCRKCDGKERRNPISRGFKVLKAYPHRGMLLVPKYILENLGDLIEIQTAPSMPVAVIFQKGLPLKAVREVLRLISDTLEQVEENLIFYGANIT